MLRLTGVDEIKRNLQKLRDKAKQLDGSHRVPLPDLMPDAFIQSHTDFQTLQEMADASGIQDNSEIGGEAWQAFIIARTRFDNWDDMMQRATQEWAARQLGF